MNTDDAFMIPTPGPRPRRRKALFVAATMIVVGVTAWLVMKPKADVQIQQPQDKPEQVRAPASGAPDENPSSSSPLPAEVGPAGIRRWSDVPLRAALLPSGLAGDAPNMVIGDHSRLLAQIANLEIDFGIDPASLDTLRRGLGMVATIDALLLTEGGQLVKGHPSWSNGQPPSYFPLGMATRSLAPDDPDQLRTKLIELLSGTCEDVVRKIPSQFQVPDIEAGIRTRALVLLASLAKAGDEQAFRSGLASDQAATVRSAALVGLEKLGHTSETADLVRSWYSSEVGMRPALLAALGGGDHMPTMVAPDSRVGGAPVSSLGASHDDFVADAFSKTTEPSERSLAVRAMLARAHHPAIREQVLQVLESSNDAELLREALGPASVELQRDPRYFQALRKRAGSEDLTVRLMAGAMLSLYPVQENLDLALQWTRDENELVVRQGLNMLTTAGVNNPTQALQRISELQTLYPKSRTALYLTHARDELTLSARDPQGFLDRQARYYKKLQEGSTR